MNEQVAALFHDLADLAPGAREERLATISLDPDLRRELEELLAFDGGSHSGALERDIGVVAGRALAAHCEVPSDLAPDKFCGPFKLVKQIGRGGMGVVYLAERADGEVRQRAAVKLLSSGGLHDPVMRSRFLQERQILASLTHPNIARLLDAGHLDDGQPFLVMEYVDGQPIDQFAESLSIQRKIELILRVCEAVSYLHRNLVVHRDLKPGNILVTAEGEPKLLDFGIAKILDLAADSTVTGLRMLTPDYASPEQVAGSAISTSSDVYSLGAVVYRLLTGRSPHVIGNTSPGAIAAAVVTAEVARPGKLVPAIKGDLEAILLKTLRKEPAERYPSVEHFADDLRAYLDSRPIRARQGDWAYQLRKIARRYWLPASAAAVLVAGLAAGLYTVNRERALAERRFTDVRQLANRLFDIDAQVSQLTNSASTRQLIVDTSLEYLARLESEGPVSSELALDLGTAYMRVARVQGIPLSANLGQTKNAGENLAAAERLIARVLAEQPSNRAAMLRSAQIAHDQMSLAESDPNASALPLARRAEEWLQKFLLAGTMNSSEAQDIVTIGVNVANQYQISELSGDAILLLERVKECAANNGQSDRLGGLRITLARTKRRLGDFDGALSVIREYTRGPDVPVPGDSINSLRRFRLALATEASALYQNDGANLGRPADAIPLLERAGAIGSGLIAREPNDALIRMAAGTDARLLANAFLALSNPRRALASLDSGLGHLAAVKNNSRARLEEIRNHAVAARILLSLGRRAEARTRLDAAFRNLRELKLYPSGKFSIGGEVDSALRAEAEYQAEANGGHARAIALYREILAATAAAKPEERLDEALDYSNIYRSLAQHHGRAGEKAAQRDWESRRLALWRHWERKLPANSFVVRQLAEK